MATSSLHPHTNPFRDPNRTPITPQATGSSTISNPFLSPAESLSSQTTGTGHYLTPQSTGIINSGATGAFSTPLAPIETQNTGTQATSASVAQPEPTATPAPPSRNAPSLSFAQSTYTPPSAPPPKSAIYAPPPSTPPRPAPRAPSPVPAVSISEPPPPYTPAADVRHGEIPLETGPRRAYAPDWHPDGQTWRNESVLPSSSPTQRQEETQWDQLTPTWRRDEPSSPSSSRPSVVASQAGSSSWSGYPGQLGVASRPPPAHPSSSGASLGRSHTTVGTSRVTPGPPTTVPTPGRALLYKGKVLAYPARYECSKCHLTGYQAYDPSNPCRECWSLFAQPYEGVLTFAPWDSPESVTSDEQNLQRPLPGGVSRPRILAPGPSSRPLSHPQSSPYSAVGQPPGSLPPAGWSTSPARPSGTISYAGRAPPGALVVRPGDPRIGGRVCWKCSGEGWQYKSMGLETKTCSACNGLGRLF